MDENILLVDNEIDEVDEDDLVVLDFIEFGIPHQIYERANYFETMDDITFRKRFRLSKEAVQNLLVHIENRLEFPMDLNNCVSPINQLLTTLRLYSTGGHLDTVADFAGMHLSTVSRIVVRVSEAIAELAPLYINMPTDINTITKTQQNFYDTAAFPKCIGAIDCTHFRISSPGKIPPIVLILPQFFEDIYNALVECLKHYFYF